MSSLEFWSLGEEISVRDAFGRALMHMAKERNDWVLLDADVAGGTGAKPLVTSHPERVMQFGIAEQNMMAASSGVADSGLIPVVSTFAAFGTMRAHEQFRTAVCYANRNVKLCCSHVGMDVGPDGATAQAIEDLSIMRAIPNTVVISPADANEFMRAFIAILDYQGPVYMRIGRSPTTVIIDGSNPFVIGKAYRIKEGNELTIIATGVLVARALKAAAELDKLGVSTRVINMPTIKPLDLAEIEAAATDTGAIITAEDHSVIGGLGGAVAEACARIKPTPIEFIGVQDVFGKSGENLELAEKFGLDINAIITAAKKVLKRK